MGHGVLPCVGSVRPQRARSSDGRSKLPRRACAVPSLADWCDLLTLVLRGRLRRTLGRLRLISPEGQIALIEADLPAFARLRAVVAPSRP